MDIEPALSVKGLLSQMELSPNRDLPGLKYMKTKRLKLPERNHLPADIVLQFVPKKQ